MGPKQLKPIYGAVL